MYIYIYIDLYEWYWRIPDDSNRVQVHFSAVLNIFTWVIWCTHGFPLPKCFFQKFEFDTYLQDLCQVIFPTQSFYWSRCPAEHHRLSPDLLEPTATFALRLNALLLGFLGWMGSQKMVGWVWPKMGEDVVPKWQVSLGNDDKLWDLVPLGVSSTTWYLLTPQNSYHFGIDFWWGSCVHTVMHHHSIEASSGLFESDTSSIL